MLLKVIKMCGRTTAKYKSRDVAGYAVLRACISRKKNVKKERKEYVLLFPFIFCFVSLFFHMLLFPFSVQLASGFFLALFSF